MKKTLLILIIFISCKKENESPAVPVMRNIKYEASVRNSLCIDVNYDGSNYHSIKTLRWDYTFQKEVGASLSLSGQACDYIPGREIVLSIYQDGQLIQTKSGSGLESLTYTVK